jgi:hypothetical protein
MNEWNGRMKGYRFTQGVARYATDTSYAVPSLPLPTRSYETASTSFSGAASLEAIAISPVAHQGSASFGGVGAMAADNDVAARYWRLYIRRNVNTATYDNITEIELREGVGGTDVTGSGTASASSGTAANAFDNNTGTVWTSSNQWTDWIAYDFGAGVQKAITEVAISANSTFPSDAPATWSLQYSDDNSNWTAKWYVADEDAWTASQQRVYNASNTHEPQSTYSYAETLDAADILGSDIRAWFAADLLSSGAQSYWSDISGRNRHMGQGMSTFQPTTSVGALNSLNVVDFGSDFFTLDAPWDSGDTSGSIYMVIRTDTEGTNHGFVDLSSSSEDDHFLYTNQIYTSALSTSRKIVGNPTPVMTSWRIVHIHSAPSDWAFWIDGTSVYSTGTNTVYLPSETSINGVALKIGKSRGNWYLNGQIAEIIFAKGKPSTAIRQAIEGYLAHKWALTGNLDSGHPYKSTAPAYNLRLLEDNSSKRLLEDGTSYRLLE